MNKNENIIKQLHGKLDHFKDIASLVSGINIELPDGVTDSDTLLQMLTFIRDLQIVQGEVMHAIQTALHINPDDYKLKAKKKPEGADWSASEILKHCTLEDNVIKLPKTQFNKKSYGEAKTWIEEAGGKWVGGKVQGFTFPFNADRVFSILHEGKRCNLKQEYQFFATPAALADWLVSIAGGIDKRDKVCEPSAGTGAILDAILRDCPGVSVDCYEAMPENVEQLSKKPEANIIGDDWLKSQGEAYSKIIANPPFAKNQDIDHVRKMYDRLLPGGTVAAITSRHWQIGSESKCVEFRQWLDELNASVYDIDAGEFKESGTNISTVAIMIKKPVNK